MKSMLKGLYANNKNCPYWWSATGLCWMSPNHQGKISSISQLQNWTHSLSPLGKKTIQVGPG